MLLGLEVKCLNDCSGNGVCELGTCRCKPGWGTQLASHGDCSFFLMRTGLVIDGGAVLLNNGSASDRKGVTTERGGYPPPAPAPAPTSS